MGTLQAWLVVGVPAAVLAAGLFAGHSTVRAAFGYLVLAVLFVFLLVVPGSRVSAGAVGAIGVLLIAAGRGDPQVERGSFGQEVPLRVDDPEIDEPERV